MPFTNREVAVILASELNGHDPGLWFYRVERHIDNKRWIIVREGREFYFRRAMHRQPTEKRFGLTVRVYPRQAHGPARGGRELQRRDHKTGGGRTRVAEQVLTRRLGPGLFLPW